MIGHLSIQATADMLGITRMTVYRWLWDKKLKAIKVGGRVWIAEADVLGLVRQQEYAPPASHRRKRAA